MSIQVLLLMEPQEILVVRPDVKFVANNILSSFIEGMYDDKHLPVMNGVISFNFVQWFWIEHNSVIDSVLFLQKNSTGGRVSYR